MKYRKGFRLLTLGWSDSNSFVPINFSLLESSKENNLLGVSKKYNHRSLADRLRKMAQQKATDVKVELHRTAIKAGHSAKYVLFDTWFASPKTIFCIKETFRMDTIAMVKRSSRTSCRYNGKDLNIKKIYSMNKKCRGRSKYLLSVLVNLKTKDNHGKDVYTPAKIVCVRNRTNKRTGLP